MSKINPDNLTKLYYSIGEVADMFDVNTSLIRFWEKEFPKIQPKKNKKGNRLFTPKDIIIIDKIYFLVKVKGYTLDGAKNEMKGHSKVVIEREPEENNPNQQVVDKLMQLKDKLLSLKK